MPPVLRRSSLVKAGEGIGRSCELGTSDAVYTHQFTHLAHRTKPINRSIFQTGELFKDSSLCEFYCGEEEHPSNSVMLLNGKTPHLVPSLKAVFDPPSDFFSTSLNSCDTTDPSPIYSKVFLTPMSQYHSKPMKNNSTGRSGVRKLRVRDGKVTREMLPAIKENRGSVRESSGIYASPINRRKQRIRPPSSVFKRPLQSDSHEQQELEASIQELDLLLSRIRKPTLRSISVTRETPVSHSRPSPSRRYVS